VDGGGRVADRDDSAADEARGEDLLERPRQLAHGDRAAEVVEVLRPQVGSQRFQMLLRMSRESQVMFVPSSEMARYMKARTLVFRSLPPACPNVTILPSERVVRISHASVSPPTGSIAPAHLPS
jgi:hypothetical protein